MHKSAGDHPQRLLLYKQNRLIIIASTFAPVTNMSLVCLLYALVALQGFIVILHFTGKGYIISLIFELTFLSFRVLISFSQSAFKWVLPPRKSLHAELALVTGAASGIGRLISLRLAEKGSLFFLIIIIIIVDVHIKS